MSAPVASPTAPAKYPCDQPAALDFKEPTTTLPLGSWPAEPSLSAGQQPETETIAAVPVTTAEFPAPAAIASATIAQSLNVDADVIEDSPVLQRWLEEVPDLAVDIDHDPAFRTRVRIGYAEFPAADNTGGIYVGVQDVFVGRTPLTLSGEYAVNGRGDHQLFGADMQYYLLPLGWYGNIAPVLGYRNIATDTFDAEGLNIGMRFMLIPSRTGTADLSFTQSWVAPGTDEEVGLTTLAAGYAIAEDVRIGTDIQLQNGPDGQESRVGVLLEWMP
ncbi:MAG: hypothetical protein AAF609_05725 [Cyanobacteria bacterium P01_C01_bin.120]